MKKDKYKGKDKKKFLAETEKHGKKEIRHKHKEKTKPREEIVEVLKSYKSHSWDSDPEAYVDLDPFEKMG
jgi:hypothetical protein